MSKDEFIPKTDETLVIRTDSENGDISDAICDLIRRPVHEAGRDFFAYVEFLDVVQFHNLSVADLLARLPPDYNHTFLFVVDRITTRQQDFPLLIIDLYHDRGRTFRAIPSQIQGIENNLSISNMDFYEFADNTDEDGVFRGFKET